MFSLQELLLFIISGKNNVLLGCGQNRRRPCLFRKAQILEIRGQSNSAQWKEWSVIIRSLSSEALSSPQWFESGNSAQFCKLTAGSIREISLAADSPEIASVCHAPSMPASHSIIWLQIDLAPKLWNTSCGIWRLACDLSCPGCYRSTVILIGSDGFLAETQDASGLDVGCGRVSSGQR